jgi:hypothetical protein
MKIEVDSDKNTPENVLPKAVGSDRPKAAAECRQLLRMPASRRGALQVYSVCCSAPASHVSRLMLEDSADTTALAKSRRSSGRDVCSSRHPRDSGSGSEEGCSGTS